MSSTMVLTRRAFAGTAVAAVTVPVMLQTPAGTNAATGTSLATSAPTTSTALGALIRIDSADNVILEVGPSEMGQGIMSGLAQLVAEELMLDWSQVRAEQASPPATGPNPYANPLTWQC